MLLKAIKYAVDLYNYALILNYKKLCYFSYKEGSAETKCDFPCKWELSRWFSPFFTCTLINATMIPSKTQYFWYFSNTQIYKTKWEYDFKHSTILYFTFLYNNNNKKEGNRSVLWCMDSILSLLVALCFRVQEIKGEKLCKTSVTCTQHKKKTHWCLSAKNIKHYLSIQHFPPKSKLFFFFLPARNK